MSNKFQLNVDNLRSGKLYRVRTHEEVRNNGWVVAECYICPEYGDASFSSACIEDIEVIDIRYDIVNPEPAYEQFEIITVEEFYGHTGIWAVHKQDHSTVESAEKFAEENVMKKYRINRCVVGKYLIREGEV